jgi:hypothetical protein
MRADIGFGWQIIRCGVHVLETLLDALFQRYEPQFGCLTSAERKDRIQRFDSTAGDSRPCVNVQQRCLAIRISHGIGNCDENCTLGLDC